MLALGSTGKFYAQVRNGAPFEVLLAADDETPRRLEAEGLARPGTRFTYAIGRLVLWSAQPGVVDAKAEVLRKPPRGKLAIADPRLAPYGAAAIEALTKLGLLAAWQPRFVQGENIAQAYQFVATGNAPLGFVALSQVMVDGRIGAAPAGSCRRNLHAPIRQDAVLLAAGAANPAAAALLAYLRSDAGARRHPRATATSSDACRFSRDDLQAIWLTLKLAGATTVAAAAARHAARLVAGAHARRAGAAPVGAVVALPLVLPPTVLGFYLLVALGPQRLGRPAHAGAGPRAAALHLRRAAGRLHAVFAAVRGAAAADTRSRPWAGGRWKRRPRCAPRPLDAFFTWCCRWRGGGFVHGRRPDASRTPSASSAWC